MYNKDELNKIASGQMKELYERMTGSQLKRHSNQWEGSCIVCGHTFWVSDKTPDHFYCRTCGRSYYAHSLVSYYYGLTDRTQFKEALQKLAELLNVSDTSIGNQYVPVSNTDTAPILYETMPELPSKDWQAEVNKAVILAHRVLWQQEYRPQLDYLRNRGFTNETLMKYCIGYYPTKYSLDILGDDGNPIEAKRGYYIPTFMRMNDSGNSNTLTRVKVRHEDSVYKYLLSKYEADPEHNRKPDKYISIKGSKGVTLFGNQYVRPKTAGNFPNIIFVEGEFDAMTINQTAGDICKAVTFGSHSNIGKAEAWVRWYTQPDNIVVCFDNETDEKKNNQVRQHERDLRKEIIRAQSIMPKDIRGNTPVIRNLPGQYHDWNDLLQVPNGAHIIRDTLSDMFSHADDSTD